MFSAISKTYRKECVVTTSSGGLELVTCLFCFALVAAHNKQQHRAVCKGEELRIPERF